MSACGAVAFLSLRRASPVVAMIVERRDSSGPVTIISVFGGWQEDWQSDRSQSRENRRSVRSQLTEISYQVCPSVRHRATILRQHVGSSRSRVSIVASAAITRCFSSDTKFESGTGWPASGSQLRARTWWISPTTVFGMRRTAVSCRLCDAHLGHVFDDGPRPTGQRYCMNSAAMNFVRIG